MEGGALGRDRCSGPTSSATSCPSRSGLTAITPRSGATEIHSSGIPYSGPVPITPGAQPTTMFTADTHTGPRTRLARHGVPETTGSTPSRTDLAQTCGGLAPGVTDLPIDRIEATLRLTDEQLKALDALKTASSQASDVLRASCSSEVPQTPLGRLDAAQKRIDGMMQALAIVRTPLDNFYNSLNDEQRRRFAALGAAPTERANRRGFGSDNDLAALCSRRAEGFTQLPAQRVEQVVRPTQQQLDAFDKLKRRFNRSCQSVADILSYTDAANTVDRFDAVAKRLSAMDVAMQTVRPALARLLCLIRR